MTLFARKELGKAERIAMLRNNLMSAAIPLRPQIIRRFPSFSRVGRPIHPSSFAFHPSSTPRSPQTPSLPDARPRSDRLRCGGRESNFLAVVTPPAAATHQQSDTATPQVATTPQQKAARTPQAEICLFCLRIHGEKHGL